MEMAKRFGAYGAAAIVALAGFALGDYAILAWLSAVVLVCLGLVLESPRAGAVATAVVGLGCSLYLLQLKLSESSGSSICDVNATVSCSVVNASPASELFGIPIAVLGAGFFLGVAFAAAAQPALQSRVYQTVGLLAIVGSVYSAYLGFEAVKIGATCPMCLTIYAANGLLVLASVLGARELGTPLFGQLGQVAQSTSALTVAGTFAVVVLLGATYYKNASRTRADEVMDQLGDPPAAAPAPGSSAVPQPAAPPATDDLAQKLRELYVTPRGALTLEGDEPVLGDPNAPYMVVEYACFGCPHCAQTFPHLKQLVEAEPLIQVRFRPFPLSAECNPALSKGGRPEVCRAAMAARCATEQGKFWDFAGLVFANQRSLGDELLASAANQVGLDFQKFSACMSNPETLTDVQRDAVSGGMMQIPGTPAMFLKGATGDQWIEACYGVDAVAAIVKAHKSGVTVLPPTSNMCPME
ncbi:MAG: thioredoxin domain-containing protein [Myxococcota bacterium]